MVNQQIDFNAWNVEDGLQRIVIVRRGEDSGFAIASIAEYLGTLTITSMGQGVAFGLLSGEKHDVPPPEPIYDEVWCLVAGAVEPMRGPRIVELMDGMSFTLETSLLSITVAILGITVDREITLELYVTQK